MSTQDQDDNLPALPPAVHDRLFAVLFGDPERLEPGIAELTRSHPEHATSIAAHHRRHVDCEGLAPSVIDGLEIPGYRLLGVLGEGGMGTVYRAKQLQPVRRTVALKVIKSGMDSRAVLARFEQERQSLAAMDHDTIARVFDCGTTAQGQPFFAMELVQGLPIHHYCDEHRLSLPERLSLFAQVCAGVQHAHQKGVIHRDLKPGNVLVTSQEGRHVAKIIDFGLARATDRQLTVGTQFTEQGMIVGTPEYMSPEQALGDTLRIDSRTDVYSLGVMLYELLVGVLPFPWADIRKAGLAGIHQHLANDEPPKPSARLSRGPSATTCADQRRLGVEALRRELARDLDWVVLKAMAKEPEHRYASATALADDVLRYLRQEPVLAGPPTAGYRVRKFVRRYRLQVLAVAAVFVTALVGGGSALQFALREQAKNREFDLVAANVHYEKLMAGYEVLHPPHPARSAAMAAWLRDGEALLAMRPVIEATLAELRRRGLPLTAARLAHDRATHPRAAELARLEGQLATWRRARSLRGGPAPQLPQLTPEQRGLEALVLRWMAHDRIDLGTGRRLFGEEALGLACALAAVDKDVGPARSQSLDTLALALFVNGRFDEAREQAAAAVASAPEGERDRRVESASRLEAAISGLDERIAELERQQASLAAEVATQRSWDFPQEHAAQRFLHDSLVVLLDRLRELETRTMAEVRQRLQWSQVVAAASRNHPLAHHSWDDVRAALARADDLVASKLYAGADLALPDEHVIGLVPIGCNPVTKLWEFYELRSAWDGVRDPLTIPIPTHDERGHIDVQEDTGIVFVLLPGGNFLMGAQGDDPDGPHYDRALKLDGRKNVQREAYGPVHAVTLGPFLLARHELTKAQWQRLWRGDDDLRDANLARIGRLEHGVRVTGTHPVEAVDWVSCTRMLTEHGLVLPTEAQWEYACRAGAKGLWQVDPDRLGEVANIADASVVKEAGLARSGAATWNDRYVNTSPVGNFAANPFGLFDMHGNVWEWCQDPYGPYFAPVAVGDGRRQYGYPADERVLRGGSCADHAGNAQIHHRRHPQKTQRFDSAGLRAARRLVP